MYVHIFNVEISNIVFRGVEVKKSEIRLKSENLHPCGNRTSSLLRKNLCMVNRPNKAKKKRCVSVNFLKDRVGRSRQDLPWAH